jgi:hypothetical protein
VALQDTLVLVVHSGHAARKQDGVVPRQSIAVYPVKAQQVYVLRRAQTEDVLGSWGIRASEVLLEIAARVPAIAVVRASIAAFLGVAL